MNWDGEETVSKNIPQGLKPRVFLVSFGTAEQFGEKSSILERDRHQPLQGLKPDIDFIGFIGTTEVVPCYKTSRNCAGNSFSPSCEAVR
ncbi:MAG: hypothetical protein ABSE46_14300 [Terracidiphilus sp.]